jgi:hypothetical protein
MQSYHIVPSVILSCDVRAILLKANYELATKPVVHDMIDERNQNTMYIPTLEPAKPNDHVLSKTHLWLAIFPNCHKSLNRQ